MPINIINGNNNPNVLQGTSGIDYMYGNGGDDTLLGGGGDDLLHGGAGGDTMIGGTGNDKYFVDSAFDKVVELAGEGDQDSVYASVTFNVPTNIEYYHLQAGAGSIDAFGNSQDNKIYGNEGDNSIWGGGGNDTIWGDGGNDHLYGGNGNDSLIGGAGADVLRGGLDNDSYWVDNSDTVIENANEGWDHVYVLNQYTLGANLEELTLQGHAGFDLEGNELHNVIEGNSGESRIDGRGGADDLIGHDGNDTFVFRAGEANGDRVLDFTNLPINGDDDQLEFQGYGPCAMFQHIDGTDQWTISSADGSIQDTITLVGVTSVDPSHIHFV